MSARLPRIQDVARLAGVSTATVSRALTQPDRVAESTRAAVLGAVAETGYRVNQAARNLRRQRAGALLVLVPDLGNPFFSYILAGIESVAAPAGYGVLIADTNQPRTAGAGALDYLDNTRADGLIILDGSIRGETFARDGDLSTPLVFACECLPGTAFPSVTIDNKEGAVTAVAHLIGLGHRAIGHVCGPAGNVLTDARREGAIDAIRAAGLEVRSEWFFPGDWSVGAGAAAAEAWLERSDRPTAMFCASDQMAFGFMSRLNAAGVRTPEDISVVGFDDIELARHFVPPLTTVRQPRHLMGEMAAQLLIAQIDADPGAGSATSRTLPVELIVRGSTAAVH